MTRRDIIIMAVLVNAGLLAILFMMAINTDEDKVSDPIEISQTAVTVQPQEIPLDRSELSFIPASTGDEVDNALKEFAASPSPQAIVIEEETVQDMDQDDEITRKPEPAPPPPVPELIASSSKTVTVTVKRGDSLDKIARANGTTVKAIKDANHLKSDKLNVGQVLQVPSSNDKKKPTPPASKKPATPITEAAKSKSNDNAQVAQTDSQYYTVKNGDNPWKIAKQSNIKVEDLLKLNNLDEEKARNLKAGDRIRIR
jgi:peptidoglycan DL-endopeptidase LytF